MTRLLADELATLKKSAVRLTIKSFAPIPSASTWLTWADLLTNSSWLSRPSPSPSAVGRNL